MSVYDVLGVVVFLVVGAYVVVPTFRNWVNGKIKSALGKD